MVLLVEKQTLQESDIFTEIPPQRSGGKADTLLSFSSCQNIWAAVWRAVVQRVCSAAAAAEKHPDTPRLHSGLEQKISRRNE